MLPILLFLLTFVFTVIIICCLPCRKHIESYEREIEDLKTDAKIAIMELTNKILRLAIRYQFMSAYLAVDNPSILGLGPLPYESKTFHINKGVTRDLVEGMIELLKSARRDLDREEEAIDLFWEKWVRTNGDMPSNEVTRAIEMMTEWRDGKGGAVAKEVVAEAQKYFGMDDGIEARGFTMEVGLDQMRSCTTCGEFPHSECCGSK